MVEQAEAAAEELSRRFIGPRLGIAAPPPPPPPPPISREGDGAYGGYPSADGRELTYAEYLEDHQRRLVAEVAHRRRVRESVEDETH